MNAIKLIAVCTLLTGAGASFSHESANGQASHATVAEQKDWGIAGDAKKVVRTITLTMADNMRFTPDRIEVKEGETVRLRVRNAGKMLHELVIGTPKELAEHAEMMLKHPGMEHDEPYMVHVTPGKTGQIVWTFNRTGEFEFACLIAGHYQAGMKGSIRVIAPPQSKAAAPRATPYAGQQQREIKALSPEEVQAYAQGQGFGFAKAAELNGYPGPLHTLELAQELDLSEEQRARTQALLTQHKAEARQIGAQLIEGERALDQAFSSQTVDEKTLAALIAASGEKLAQLRAAHLQTHLVQTAMLTAEQIARYKTLRGYDKAVDAPRHDMQPGHHPAH